ncbi:MAG TPA: RNA polymerase subunit sigma-24 [Verrucomicrobiales bacterium]|nr:RNA polymerase subunit sigma-24 [Verrucomicrobiales bacterium]
MTGSSQRQPGGTGGGGFCTTLWSVVLSARDRKDGEGTAALEHLCQTYWPAIYGFLRRDGHSPADAEDLTQGFLASLLARSSLDAVAPERGRFRSFLLASLRHYVADQRDRAHAVKRGGGRAPIPLDAESAESHYARQVATGETPETIFERQWADTLFQRAQEKLRSECEAAGKLRLYEDLGPQRASDRLLSDAEVGARHGLSENAIRIASYRLRQRYQELVRAEISQTVSSAAELEEEIRHLIGVFGKG